MLFLLSPQRAKRRRHTCGNAARRVDVILPGFQAVEIFVTGKEQHLPSAWGCRWTRLRTKRDKMFECRFDLLT